MSNTTQVESSNQVEANVLAGTQEKFDVIKEFGTGRYSAAMAELYHDSGRLLELSHKRAVKLAKSFGAELGRQNAVSAITFGKRSKDGKMTLRESATIKGVTVTFAIAMAKACVLLQDARSYGIVDAQIMLRQDYIDWLDS